MTPEEHRAYVRVSERKEWLEARVRKLERERAYMVEALQFYADLNAYYDEYGHTDLAAGDAGQRAREALEAL